MYEEGSKSKERRGESRKGRGLRGGGGEELEE